MKSRILKITAGTILTLTGVLTIAFGITAQEKSGRLAGGGSRLVGTWDARVAITNCQTGAEIRSFKSIGTFMFGGTMLDSTSGMPQQMKTPGHGVWSHTEGNTYKFSFKSFSFDPPSVFTGWTIIRHEATLDSKGDAYTSTGTAEFYDASGNLTGTGCSSTTAVRFE